MSSTQLEPKESFSNWSWGGEWDWAEPEAPSPDESAIQAADIEEVLDQIKERIRAADAAIDQYLPQAAKAPYLPEKIHSPKELFQRLGRRAVSAYNGTRDYLFGSDEELIAEMEEEEKTKQASRNTNPGSRKSVLSKVKSLPMATIVAGQNLLVDSKDYFKEKPERKYAAMIVGGVAVAAAAGLGYWLSTRHGVHHNHISTTPQDTATTPHHVATTPMESIPKPKPHTEVVPPPHTPTLAAEHVKGYGVLEYSGNTIWGDVSQQLSHELGRQATNSEISNVTRQVLSTNGLSWEDARHLPIGYQYNSPSHLVSLLHK